MGLEGLRMSAPGLIPPDKWNELVAAVEAATITSFTNGSYRRGLGGTALEGLPSYRGPSLHVLELGDLVPDPFSIAGKVIESVSTQLIAAVPLAADIANIILAPLTAAASAGTSPGSVVDSVKALFSGALGVLDDIEGMVLDLIGDINPIKSGLEAHFAAPTARRPKNGDVIYTEALGIVYELHRQNDEGIPSGNTIFRVPFEIDGTVWVALTRIPAPDLPKMVKEIAGVAIKLLQSLVSAVVDAALQAVAAGLIALFEAIQEFLDQLEDILDEIANIWGAIAALETLLNAAVEVMVIGADGIKNTITVLQNVVGDDLKKDFTWIQSKDGHGKKSQIVLFGDPVDNIEDVDWRDHYYIGQDGKMMRAYLLTQIKPEPEFPKEEAQEGAMELTDIEMCQAGETVTKKVLIKPPEEE